MKLIVSFIMMLVAETIYAEDNYMIKQNINYSSNIDEYSSERCKLDIYYPAEGTGHAAVIWFHGGGLTGGEKFIPDQLKESGLIIVAPNYRLIPQVDIEDCIDDAAAAVAWTFNNIKDFNGSNKKIFVAGHSAGGYLTSMIGLDRQWLEKYGIDADSIAGLIPYSGQVITHFAHRKRKGMSELQPCVDSLAPLFHVRPDAPPYIIITGDKELELYGRYEENAYMWRMMNLVGHRHTSIYKLDGYNHGEMAVPAHHILKHHIRQIVENKQ